MRQMKVENGILSMGKKHGRICSLLSGHVFFVQKNILQKHIIRIFVLINVKAQTEESVE